MRLRDGFSFKRVWNILALTKTPEEVVFGSWLAPGYSADLDLRDFGMIDCKLKACPNDLILDVGCGALGRALVYFGQKGFRIVGIDISVAAAAEAKRCLRRLHLPGSVDLVVGDAEYLPFREGLFDKVLVASMLSHLPSRRNVSNVLKQVRLCMKDSGVCFLGWWLNLFSPFSFILVFANRANFFGKSERIQLLSFKGSREIQLMCERAGLSPARVEHGSVFWYVFYLFPKSVHSLNEKLLRVLQDFRTPGSKFSLPPFFFDVVVQKVVP